MSQTVPRPEWAAVSMSYGPSGPQLAHPKLFAQKLYSDIKKKSERTFRYLDQRATPAVRPMEPQK